MRAVVVLLHALELYLAPVPCAVCGKESAYDERRLWGDAYVCAACNAALDNALATLERS